MPTPSSPILPAGASFASVLAGVDEFSITGAAPGFFFTNAFWDVQIDNITVNAVPEPACISIALAALCLLLHRQR